MRPTYTNLTFGFILLMIFMSCSKTDKEPTYHADNTLDGQWYMVYSTGGRTFPVHYDKGDITWQFNANEVLRTDNRFNTTLVSTYVIVENNGESHLELDGHYYGNITTITQDSFVLNAALHIGCGGRTVFLR